MAVLSMKDDFHGFLRVVLPEFLIIQQYLFRGLIEFCVFAFYSFQVEECNFYMVFVEPL